MSSWCSPCSDYMFGENVKPDWDIEKMFNDLQKSIDEHGKEKPFLGYGNMLCEGCGLMAIGINKGKRVAVYHGLDKWVDYDSEKGMK